MSMAHIRQTYGVPAKRGMRIEYSGNLDKSGKPRLGTIAGSAGERLRIRMDGEPRTGIYHPTWKIKYLNEEARL